MYPYAKETFFSMLLIMTNRQNFRRIQVRLKDGKNRNKKKLLAHKSEYRMKEINYNDNCARVRARL